MRALIGLTAAVALMLGATAAPATASETLLSKHDKKGDVKLYKSKTLSKVKKKSIDIDRASIVELDNGKYRYKVRIKKIYKSKKWDQMVFFETKAPGSGPEDYTTVGFKIRSSGGAYGYDSMTEDSCKLSVRRSGRSAWVDVPERCAPYDGDKVRVSTVTGYYQTDDPAFSSDKLKLGTFHYAY